MAGPLFLPGLLIGTGPVITCTDVQVAPQTTGTARGIASVDIGRPSATRFVVVFTSGGSGGPPATMTVNGVSLPQIYQASAQAVFYGGIVASGSTVATTFTLTASSTQSSAFGFFTVENYTSTTPIGMDTLTSGANANAPQTVSGTNATASARAFIVASSAVAATATANVTGMTSLTPAGGVGPNLFRSIGLYFYIGVNAGANTTCAATCSSVSTGQVSVRSSTIGWS